MYDDIIRRYSDFYDVPVPIIMATIARESSWDPMAYREEPQIHDASYGLMQLLTRTAGNLGYSGAPDGLYDPEISIQYGTKLLAEIIGAVGLSVPERIYSKYVSGNADRYLTSTEVANDVSKWMNFLKGYELTGSAGSIIVPLVLLVLIVWNVR